MSKKEVEKNEEGLFAKWITQTDEMVNAWRQDNIIHFSTPDSSSSILPAPTYYERRTYPGCYRSRPEGEEDKGITVNGSTVVEGTDGRRDKGDKLELTQLQKIKGEAGLIKQLEEAEAGEGVGK
ncbi:hypothetical protein FRC10_006725 [Ceratobasidium sp. 414]|nr:hypothetical protein FRC10_006725 [Ceratobasidium sp. 414]